MKKPIVKTHFKTILAGLVFILTLAPARAVAGPQRTPTESKFCKAYEQDKKRIAEVKKKGWIRYPRHKNETQTYRFGCLDLKWREQLYQNLCLGKSTEIRLPKAILFYFDGAAYFRPKEAKRTWKAVNLLGTEGQGFLTHGINALSTYIESIQRKGNFNFTDAVELHYHSGSGFSATQGIANAEVCYSKIASSLRLLKSKYPEATLPKRIVLGHSNGGASAISFVKHFTNKSSKNVFDLLLTIDPVPRAAGYAHEKITNSEKVYRIQDRLQVRRIVNLYQTTDTGTLAGIAIKGSRIENADLNVQVNMEPDRSFGRNHDHKRILENPTVIETITREFFNAFY